MVTILHSSLSTLALKLTSSTPAAQCLDKEAQGNGFACLGGECEAPGGAWRVERGRVLPRVENSVVHLILTLLFSSIAAPGPPMCRVLGRRSTARRGRSHPRAGGSEGIVGVR